MRDVIHKVIGAEAEAKRIVESARAEAEQTIARTRTEAQKLAAESAEKTRMAVQELLTAVVRQAELEKQQQLLSIAAEFQTAIHVDPEAMHRAIESSIHCICGTREPPERSL
jgi:vacuolar-type H+-ATPase subunit H